MHCKDFQEVSKIASKGLDDFLEAFFVRHVQERLRLLELVICKKNGRGF